MFIKALGDIKILNTDHISLIRPVMIDDMAAIELFEVGRKDPHIFSFSSIQDRGEALSVLSTQLSVIKI